MAPPTNPRPVEIESFESRRGVAGAVQLRPIAGQTFSSDLRVEGNKSLVNDYPVGSRFRVQAALTDRPGGGQFLYSSWQWDVVVRDQPS